MAKFLAWCLFLVSTALFIGSLAMQQAMVRCEEVSCKMSDPLPDMVRFQQACVAGDRD